jgi:hypothetical protein
MTCTNNHRAKVQTYMAQKITNLVYDAALEVRSWRRSAEVAIIREVYLNGSKIGDKFGAAEIIILNSKLAHQLKLTLHGHRSKNQAEQIAILKTSEKLE